MTVLPGAGVELSGTVNLHEVFKSFTRLFFSPVYNFPAYLSKTSINLIAQQLTSVNILRLQLASANWASRNSRTYKLGAISPDSKRLRPCVCLSAQFHFLSNHPHPQPRSDKSKLCKSSWRRFNLTNPWVCLHLFEY